MSGYDDTTRERVRAHVSDLYDRGLISLPRWGGGKALPGTDHAALADNPPAKAPVVSADYSGGLAILLGNDHTRGGFVLGADIDNGPVDFPWRPYGFQMLERGTAPGKWHLYLRSRDRLDGVLYLRGRHSGLVCEIKGRGQALRSWPTNPPDKPKAYTIEEIVDDASTYPLRLTAREVAEGMADLLSRVLGERIDIDNRVQHARKGPRLISPGLASAIDGELARRGVHLRNPGRDGWQPGRCPFHPGRSRTSLAVSFELQAWHCWAGCGSGGLRGLAVRLGLRVPKKRRGKLILPTVEVSL